MSSHKNFVLSPEAREVMNKKQSAQNIVEHSQREEGKKIYGYPTQRHINTSKNKALHKKMEGKKEKREEKE